MTGALMGIALCDQHASIGRITPQLLHSSPYTLPSAFWMSTCIDRATHVAAAAQFPVHAAVRTLDGQHASIGRITPQQLHNSPYTQPFASWMANMHRSGELRRSSCTVPHTRSRSHPGWPTCIDRANYTAAAAHQLRTRRLLSIPTIVLCG
ncbi:hypothetical protein M5X06_00210 [Paenibacillus alvei]|uniref:hypothetical protein n=1 Tax=Paenibacillus alvei TaxID=44250 RepID=UPI00227DCFC8|nr:hypothetical protein [Paenibacillus alvei]MCY9765258.1 hypothetical protein [Paenibacillus alvei]